MKNIVRIIFLSALAVMTSCSKDQICSEYLNLDKTSYTFGQQGGSLTVNVDASSEWKIENGSDWLAHEVSGSRVVFTAGANEAAERSATVAFLIGDVVEAELTINQLCSEFSGDIIYFGTNTDMRYSPKGKYAVRIDMVTVGGLPSLELYMVNNETGETVRLDDIEAKVRNSGEVVGISDYGHVLVNGEIYHDGKFETISLPSEFESFTMTGISSDGQTVIGTGRVQMENSRPYVPFKWSNGTYTELEVPETDVLDRPLKDEGGVFVGGMSDDGSVIWGYDNTSADNYASINGLIYWKDGKTHYVGKESAEIRTYTQYGNEKRVPCLIHRQSMLTSAAGPKISPDGKYILAEYYEVEIVDNNIGDEYYYPAVVDTETGEFTVLRDFHDMLAYTITSKGEIFGAAPYFDDYIAEDGVVLMPAGESYESVGVGEYFSRECGMIMSDKMLMYRYIPESNQYLGMKLTGKTMYGGQYQNFTVFTK